MSDNERVHVNGQRTRNRARARANASARNNLLPPRVNANESMLVHRRLNSMTGKLEKMEEHLAESRAMFHELLPVLQATHDAAVGGQENLAEVAAKMDSGFKNLGTLFRREHSKITNPLHYIYLYYYTLYTLLRLACESLIAGSKPFREYALALPLGLSLLVILIYIVLFLLFIFVYEIGIFFGSIGILHYYGRQHDVFEIIVTISIKLIGSVCLTLWDLKGFFLPYGRIMKNAFISGFRLEDQSFKDSMSEGASYIQNKTTSAVSSIVNQSISAAVDRLPTMGNISTAVAAGLASHVVGATGAIATGAVDLGSAVASGTSKAVMGAVDLGSVAAEKASDFGSAAYLGVSAAAGKASELGTAFVESDAVKATAQAAKDAASATAQATRNAAAKARESASKWLYGNPVGGGLNVLDRFKKFDDIHILNGTQLDTFNSSEIGVFLKNFKSKMDLTIVNNVEQNMGTPVNEKALRAMNCAINVILDRGVPLLMNELYKSVPLCEYIERNNVVLKKNNKKLFPVNIVAFYEENRLSTFMRSRSRSRSNKPIKRLSNKNTNARRTRRQIMP
jgi:hypothetical protein